MPLIKEQAVVKQGVVHEHQDTTPQQDEANVELRDTSADKEERVGTSLVEGQAAVDKGYKTPPHQDEALAEVAKISADNEEQATT